MIKKWNEYAKVPSPASRTRFQLRNITNKQSMSEEKEECKSIVKRPANLDEEEPSSSTTKQKKNDHQMTAALDRSEENQNEDADSNKSTPKNQDTATPLTNSSTDTGQNKNHLDEKNVTSSMSRRISLRSHKNSESTQINCDVLSNQLLTLISNLYLNVTQRLRLDFPPRCAEDFVFCRYQHYNVTLLKVAPSTQRQLSICALQQQRYETFINTTMGMCLSNLFPGDGIFTKLTEIILSMNLNTDSEPYLEDAFNHTVELFYLIILKFPPCWLAMRQFYVNFMTEPINTSKISIKNYNNFSKSEEMFCILLDLCEMSMKLYSESKLSENENETEDTEDQQKTQDDDESDQSDYCNVWEFEYRENAKQTFEALKPSERLDRCFLVLRLVLRILEYDFAMWILHHHKKTRDWIFCSENRPLVILIFDLRQYKRLSSTVIRLFSIFSSGVNMNLSTDRLQVLERFISLIMESSNIADMENTVLGVKFPYLGLETKKLIWEFFKIFKTHNLTSTLAYIQAAELLRIPYVRYEFIDRFLQLFPYSNVEGMSPKKITHEIIQKRWRKYKKQADLRDSTEDISSEQFLYLLLLAFKAYCKWHGCQQYLRFISQNEHIESYKTTTDSVHRNPVKGAGGVLMLSEMGKDIKKLEKQLKMEVRMSKPKVDLPTADICFDEEIVGKYRTDLKYITVLHNIMNKLQPTEQDMFKEWKKYLNDFIPF